MDAGLDIRLRNRWNLQTTLSHRIDLDPAAGQGKTDTIFTIGVSYSLNGFLKEKEDRADERKTLKKKVEKKEGTPMGWIRNAALTAGLARGNSENMTLKIDYDSAFRSKTNEFFLKGGFQFAESDGENVSNRFNASTRYNWKLGSRNYMGIGSGFLHDDAAQIRYRLTPGAHAGRYFILTNAGGFSLEGGLSYTTEERNSLRDNFLSIQAAQRLYWQVGQHTYITQEIAYVAPLSDPSLYNLSSYLYLDTILSEKLSWRVGAEYYFNSTPVAGAKKDDFSLSTGIAIRF